MSAKQAKNSTRNDKTDIVDVAFGKSRWGWIRMKWGGEKCKTTKRSNPNHWKIQTPFKRRKQEGDEYSRQAGRITFFFYQDFLSRTLTTHRTAGEGRGPFFFIPLYHFHPLTNIQLCRWDDYHIFLIAPLVFTRLTAMRFTTLSNYHWLIDDVKLVFFVCLLNDLIENY